MAISVCKFSKFLRGSIPWTPLESFLVLQLLKIKSAEKTAVEKVTKIGALFRNKNSD